MLRRLAPLLLLAACKAPPAWPGPQQDGSVLLPNGWSLQPFGKQVELPSDLPVRLALHPGGRWLAIQHAGYRRHQVTLFDTEAGRVTASMPLARTWSGMAWSRDGSRLHVSGGADDVVQEFTFDADTGTATAAGRFAIGDPARLDLVAGMCAGANGALFVCTQRRPVAYLLDPAGKPLWTTPLPDDSQPFDCALAGDGATLFVSLWARAEVWALASNDGSVRGKVATGPHPSELLLHAGSGRLFVTDGNDNTVTVIDGASLQVQETIGSALFPDAPPGSTPNALALSPDGKTLLIANADNNDCAVVDVREPGKAQSRGFVPVGCYPTSVRFAANGRTVYVANGKGSTGSHGNPDGPQPGKPQKTADDYTGSLFGGSLSVFRLPDLDDDDDADRRQRAALTATSYRCAPLAAGAAVRNLAERPADSPIPARPGEPSPIRHVVYVIKENRTYDQMLGDLEQGHGEPKLCLFPRAVTPNHHALAEQFVLLDNFYVEAEVSADGHDWSMGAYATDFIERTWPVVYSGKDHASKSPRRAGEDEHVPASERQLGYPGEGNFPLGSPQNGYLWDLAARAGISYRSYGEFVQNGATRDAPGTARVQTLVDHFDPLYRSFDLDYPDADRASRFLHELAACEQRGAFPQLVVLRLPNDHTAGTAVGKHTPTAMVADNDAALGRILEGLSHSRFWPELAVFVLEDDAQNGPDHIDAHRSIGLVAGPYVRRAAVVHAMYSTCSVLRTIELILGLPAMSQFDAAAAPMWDCFTGTPDLRPFAALPPAVSLDERNQKTAYGAERSATFDFSREDAADDLALNEVIWRSIRGADSPMPRPRRAAFVRALVTDD